MAISLRLLVIIYRYGSGCSGDLLEGPEKAEAAQGDSSYGEVPEAVANFLIVAFPQNCIRRKAVFSPRLPSTNNMKMLWK